MKRFWLVLGVLVFLGCGKSGGPSPEDTADPSAAAMPVFALTDVNESSATYLADVATDDHLGHVSAWYFGHAT